MDDKATTRWAPGAIGWNTTPGAETPRASTGTGISFPYTVTNADNIVVGIAHDMDEYREMIDQRNHNDRDWKS